MKVNKLVRDNTPSLIENRGRECVTRTLDGEEYMHALVSALEEKMQDFQHSFGAYDDERAVRELADMCEIISTIVAEIGIPQDSFDKIRESKVALKGDYTGRVWLEEIKEN